MSNLSFQHILLSLLFTSSGTVGGWALAGKIGGDEAASSFLQAGISVVLVMSTLQFLLFLLGRKRLIYRVMFNIAFGCGIVWFMLCLLLPMLWVDTPDIIAKIFLFLFLMALCFANSIKAREQFELKWKEEGEAALSRHYNEMDGTVDWPKILGTMRFSVALYIPGISRSLNPVISIIIVVSMLTGLSLRNAFPTFSLFAWGVPSCLVISIFMQLIGLGFAQVRKLCSLEKELGKQLKPTN
jgi:hypothetical protein